MQPLTRWRTIIAAVVAAIVAAVSVTVVIDPDGPGPAAPRTITVLAQPQVTSRVDSADDGKAPDKVLSAPATVVAQAAPGLESGLRTESPPGVSQNAQDANQAAQEKASQLDGVPLVQSAAAPSQRGCLSRFVVNASTRRGVAPRWIVLHETVSPNVAGWADVNAIASLFNTPRSQASSSYIVDREGHCIYAVRESDKPWTQAAANPWSISFEIVNTANRARDRNLIDGAGRARLVSVMVDISKRWDIPLRTATQTACRPGRSGVLDHVTFGPCGGGHVDTNPFHAEVRGIAEEARRLCVRRYHDAKKSAPARCKMG